MNQYHHQPVDKQAVLDSYADHAYQFRQSHEPIPHADKLTGRPSPELVKAVFGFVGTELNKRSYAVSFIGTSITIKPDQRYADFSGTGIIHLFESCAHMQCRNHASVVEYDDPNMFDRIERFINLLPHYLSQ